MVYVVCVCVWVECVCVFSNWVGVLCNVGLGFFVEWGGGGEGEKGLRG